jgi:hypothetical protein
VAEIKGSHELGGSQGESPKVGCSKSRVVKWREDRDHPSEEDRWQRSKDLVNSEVRKVRAQGLGAPSHEIVKCSGMRDTWQNHASGPEG